MIMIILIAVLAISMFVVAGVFVGIKEIIPGTLFFIAQGVLFLLLSFGIYAEESYKNGQIDAANGIQKYHLTTQPDNTSEWELKEKK